MSKQWLVNFLKITNKFQMKILFPKILIFQIQNFC